jgi:hypothetical protein
MRSGEVVITPKTTKKYKNHFTKKSEKVGVRMNTR